MKPYTVIGLWLDDEPVVAGVIEGEHPCVDNDPFEVEGGRWATSVEADSPAHAEPLAIAEMIAEDRGEEEDVS